MIKSKVLIAVLVLTSLGAQAYDTRDNDFYTITSIEVKEITTDVFNQRVAKTISEDLYFPDQVITPDPIENAGRVITIARDLVALGQEVYTLVNKGRPSAVTKYAPISVVPRIGKEPVDILETEDWKMPKKKNFQITYKNKLNVKVVDFRFSVMWAYGGKYNGVGAYITSAQIIPDYVNVLWGFDFTATMKLGGIQNGGKRTNPIAQATLLLEHSVSNIFKATSKVNAYVIDGNGGFRKY